MQANTARQTTASIALAFAWVFAAAGNAEAAATVNYGSVVGSANLQSDGTPMDATFSFQIGTFSGGFAPAESNTGDWLAHWVPLVDAAGDPIAGATAAFDEIPLPSPPFPAGAAHSGFSGTAEFDHNELPFTTDTPVYLWGYNNRLTPGTAEWILVTDTTWLWPAGTANPPATTFSVGAADTAIIGSINTGTHHMQSAAVTVSSGASGPVYDSWLASQFAPEILAIPELADTVWGVLADPDADGVANVIEFFTASDPNDAVSNRPTSATTDGDHLVFTFYQAKDTSGTVGEVEWSSDLVHWQTDEVTAQVVEDLGDAFRVEARVPRGEGEVFARLYVRRSF